MAKTLTVRGVVLGEPPCKMILPVVERDTASTLETARRVAALAPDLIEWRADWFSAADDPDALRECLAGLRGAVGNIPLLVTWRTRAEGGERNADPQQYARFCRRVCESGQADLLDLELFTAPELLPELIALAHRCGVAVICSSHDFSRTPPQSEMVARLCRMQALGADIAKLAVMPRTRQDVAALLSATAEMADQHPDTPVLTMSMGALGQISRVAAGALGSCGYFASGTAVSAPGQLNAAQAHIIMEALGL